MQMRQTGLYLKMLNWICEVLIQRDQNVVTVIDFECIFCSLLLNLIMTPGLLPSVNNSTQNIMAT